MRLFLLCFIGIFSFSKMVLADCTSPAGVAGDQIFNSTHSTMQFCDGTNWYSMKGGATDILGTLSCAASQIAQWNGSSWVCLTLTAGSDNLGNHIATSALNMGNKKITNLATPTAGTDAVTKAYVDAAGGDDLGNHTATQNLSMGNFNITSTGKIATSSASSPAISGTTSLVGGAGLSARNISATNGYGVYANATGTTGVGAFGWGSASSGANFGVYGLSGSAAGFGGYFRNSNGGSALKISDGPVDMTTQKIINLADPTAAQDAATKAYVDAAAGINHTDYTNPMSGGNRVYSFGGSDTNLLQFCVDNGHTFALGGQTVNIGAQTLASYNTNTSSWTTITHTQSVNKVRCMD